jgi:(S)-ureidoglycine aminohydrolase
VQQLGDTRSANAPDHLLQTPDTFVRAPLPGMRAATAIVHITPARGARFTQYSVEFEAGGQFAPSGDGVRAQRFVFVLKGEMSVGSDSLHPGGFTYLPPGDTSVMASAGGSRAIVIEKPCQALGGARPPTRCVGRERDAPMTHMNDDPWLEVRGLVPDDPAFDFRVNTMTYEPGATLPAVEIHVMEHGLLMLEGGGIYRLGACWYPVTAGDFIWMAPYCPQWFGALGKTAAKYLIYKDWDRHP